MNWLSGLYAFRNVTISLYFPHPSQDEQGFQQAFALEILNFKMKPSGSLIYMYFFTNILKWTASNSDDYKKCISNNHLITFISSLAQF